MPLTTKTEAVNKTRELYRAVKKLLALSQNKPTRGMLRMAMDMTSTIDHARQEDVEQIMVMTEEEFLEYALPKYYPSYFKPKEAPKPIPVAENKDEKSESNQILEDFSQKLVGIGKLLITINNKLEDGIRLQNETTNKQIALLTELLACWKGGAQ